MFLKCYHVTESKGRETLLINLQDIKAIQKRYISYKEMFVITVCYDDSVSYTIFANSDEGAVNYCLDRITSAIFANKSLIDITDLATAFDI